MLRARNFCLYKIINRYFPKNWPSFFLLKKPSSCGILVDKNKSKLPSLFMNLALHHAPLHDGRKKLLQGDHYRSELLLLYWIMITNECVLTVIYQIAGSGIFGLKNAVDTSNRSHLIVFIIFIALASSSFQNSCMNVFILNLSMEGLYSKYHFPKKI